mgnify:CR=1 FL=1
MSHQHLHSELLFQLYTRKCRLLAALAPVDRSWRYLAVRAEVEAIREVLIVKSGFLV